MDKDNGQKLMTRTLLKIIAALLLWLCLAGFGISATAYADMYHWTDKQGITYIVDDPSKIPPDYRKAAIRVEAASGSAESAAPKKDSTGQMRDGQGRLTLAGSWVEKEDPFEFRGDRVAVRLESDGTGYAIINSFWKTVRSGIFWRQIDNESIELFGEDPKNSRIIKYDSILDELENKFGGHYPLRRMKQPLPPTVRPASREIPFTGFWMSSYYDIGSNQFIVIDRDGTGILFPSPDYFIPFNWSQSNTGVLELHFQAVSKRGSDQVSVQNDYARKKATVVYNGKIDMLELSIDNRKSYLFWIGGSPFQGARPSADIMNKMENLEGRKKLATEGNAGIALIVAEHFLYRTSPEHRKDCIPWLTLSAERGLPEAQYMIGGLYYFGAYFQPVNKSEGLRWLQLAAKAGNAPAIAALERIEQGGKASSKYLGYENPINYWDKGSKLADEGKLDEAIETLTKAIILNKGEISQMNMASVYQMRGHVYMRKGQYAEALADLNTAVKIDDKAAHIYNSIGLVNRSMHRDDLALAAFDKAIALDPKNKSYYGNRASTYAGREEYAKAFNDYNTTMELDPDDPAPHIGRGVVFKKQKKYKEALQEFDRAQQLEPKNFLAHYHKASLYSLWDRTTEACSEMDAAINSGLSRWKNVKTVIEKNPDFNAIRQTDCFRKELSRL